MNPLTRLKLTRDHLLGFVTGAAAMFVLLYFWN